LAQNCPFDTLLGIEQTKTFITRICFISHCTW